MRFRKLKKIGRGANGAAYLVSDSIDNTTYVAKVMNTKDMDNRDLKYAFSEIKCMAVLQHPFIIKHIMDCYTVQSLLIVMEYAEGGDLEQQIVCRGPAAHNFKEHEAVFVFLQICVAINFIHSSRMLHRDVKSANMFLTSAGIVKIGDFGYSQSYARTISDKVAQTFCGTPCYLSPELWDGSKYSKKADVWSMGVVLFELLFLRKPFTSKNMHDLREKITKDNLSIAAEAGSLYSKDMVRIVESLLEKKPEKRASTRDILEDPYIREGVVNFRSAVSSHPQIAQAEKERVIGALQDSELYARYSKTVHQQQREALQSKTAQREQFEKELHERFQKESGGDSSRPAVQFTTASEVIPISCCQTDSDNVSQKTTESVLSIRSDAIPLKLAIVAGNGTTWQDVTLSFKPESEVFEVKGVQIDITFPMCDLQNVCPLPLTVCNRLRFEDERNRRGNL